MFGHRHAPAPAGPSFADRVTARLGLPADTPVSEILGRLDTALAPVPPQVPQGMALVETGRLVELQEQAAAVDRVERARLGRIVDEAIRVGRVPARSRGEWLRLLAGDEQGARAMLESFPANTIPVAEIGYGRDFTDEEHSEARYARAWNLKGAS